MRSIDDIDDPAIAAEYIDELIGDLADTSMPSEVRSIGRTLQHAHELVFQVTSDDHVPFKFGDAGIGHITQCPHHPEIVAFGWTCG